MIRRDKPTAEAGMTLIEILSVVMLISIVLSVVAVSSEGIFGARLTKTVNKLSAMARYTYNLASLRGKMHRLVIDIDGRSYYVEEVEPVKACEEAFIEERDRKDDKEGEETEPSGKLVKDMRIKKEKLPKGISFSRVMTKHNKEPVEEGKESIHFFPDGRAEKALIWVTDGDDTFTVEVTSLLGTGIVHREELDPKELEKK